MSRPKGSLLCMSPYKITPNGKNGIKVTLSNLSFLQAGDYVYEERLDNGVILLIPESVYEEYK